MVQVRNGVWKLSNAEKLNLVFHLEQNRKISIGGMYVTKLNHVLVEVDVGVWHFWYK